MKIYKELHDNKDAAKSHIAKIKKRGGKVKQSSQHSKILLEYTSIGVVIIRKLCNNKKAKKHKSFFIYFVPRVFSFLDYFQA